MTTSTLLETENPTTFAAAHHGRALILYDGECPLCRKSVENLKRFDWRHVLEYQDARAVEQIPERTPPLDPEQLLKEMHLITPDGQTVYHGFEAFRWIAWRLPVLWVFAPLMYLPGIPTLGQKVYLWIARNRYRLVPCVDGVCHLPPRG